MSINSNNPRMIRTRFAPSPTGYLHVGGLRTALYSFLYAKKHNGKFILRIEDTDQERLVEGATENLIKILNLFNLKFDEGPDVGGEFGPYIQSERRELHINEAENLLKKNAAYRCFCTKEDLDKMREEQQRLKKPPMYDKRCRFLSSEEIKQKLEKNTPHVIRLKVPENQKIIYNDLIRGKIEVLTNTIDDQVLIKSDGFPTYHLANVVDDHYMQISHVIRGEEWLPSTPKHIILYQAFDWKQPEFAHLPLLLNPDKTKLSKRQGDVACEDYLNKGYLEEALLNFVAMLGWNPGSGETQEIFTLNELIEKFDLNKVQKAGAIFNIEKLDWMNGLYIRQMDIEKLTEQILPYLQKQEWFTKSPLSKDIKYLQECIKLEQSRIKTFPDSIPMLEIFFTEQPEYDKKIFLNEKMKVDEAIAKEALEKSLKALEKHDNFDNEETTKETLMQVITEMNVKNGQVLWPIRTTLTGREFSPGVFELLRVLGKDNSLKRIRNGIEKIS